MRKRRTRERKEGFINGGGDIDDEKEGEEVEVKLKMEWKCLPFYAEWERIDPNIAAMMTAPYSKALWK